MTWIVLAVCAAFVLLVWKVSSDGPQHWLGWLLLLSLFGAIGYQIIVRL